MVAMLCPILTYRPSLSLQAELLTLNTLKDIFSDILMNLHAVVLVECDLVGIQYVYTASDGSQVPCEDI